MWNISRTLKVSSSAVAKTIKHHDETGYHEDRHRKGRLRVTSAAEDKFIGVTSLRNCSPNKYFTEFK
jgi:predicted transcriptional regulator